MPAYYLYRCTVCNKVEERYRNARRSRCCHAALVRIEPPYPRHARPADADAERTELAAFLQGKTIAALRFDAQPGGGFDIIFTDGSEIELYPIADSIDGVLMTAEEVAAAEQDARDMRELDAQTADLRSGKAPLYEHDEVWAEIDAEERQTGSAT